MFLQPKNTQNYQYYEHMQSHKDRNTNLVRSDIFLHSKISSYHNVSHE